MKEVISMDLTTCPKCNSKLELLETNFRLYGFESQGMINKFVGQKSCSDFVCSNCGFKTSAKHSMYGVLPINYYKLIEHDEALQEGQKYKGCIGYISD